MTLIQMVLSSTIGQSANRVCESRKGCGRQENLERPLDRLPRCGSSNRFSIHKMYPVHYHASHITMHQSGSTALHEAASGGHRDLCLYLIEKGADLTLADKV